MVDKEEMIGRRELYLRVARSTPFSVHPLKSICKALLVEMAKLSDANILKIVKQK